MATKEIGTNGVCYLESHPCSASLSINFLLFFWGQDLQHRQTSPDHLRIQQTSWCLNHLDWLLLTRRSSGSALSLKPLSLRLHGYTHQLHWGTLGGTFCLRFGRGTLQGTDQGLGYHPALTDWSLELIYCMLMSWWRPGGLDCSGRAGVDDGGRWNRLSWEGRGLSVMDNWSVEASDGMEAVSSCLPDGCCASPGWWDAQRLIFPQAFPFCSFSTVYDYYTAPICPFSMSAFPKNKNTHLKCCHI